MVLETRKDGTKFTNRALKEAAERQGDVSARYEQLRKDLMAQVRLGFSMHWWGVCKPESVFTSVGNSTRIGPCWTSGT